jgi:signal transduction histidine kinase/CheY-like chemotaxis protein
MHNDDNEQNKLRSVALKNAQAILAARQRAEEELVRAKEELEQKTAALAQSLAMVRATLDATTDAILVTDNAGKVINCNEKYAQLWRATDEREPPQDLLRQAAAQFADPQQFLARVDTIQHDTRGESHDVLQLADGRVFERYSRAQMVDDKQVGRVWTFHDATRQRKVESALREESRMLELLNRTGTMITSTLDLHALLQLVTDATTELSGAKFGAFFYNTAGADGEDYTLYTLSGMPRAAFEAFGKPRPGSLFGPTLRGEPAFRIDDIHCHPHYGRLAPYFGLPPGHPPVRSYLAVPITIRSGEVIGGLFFGHPQPGVFGERSERIVVAVAAQAAVAIENARLYQGSREAAEERARLLESERSARLLAEQQNHAKDTFLAMLGHELRNPLSAISAGVAVIKTGGTQSKAGQRAFDIIGRQSGHLERIVEDLLDAARMLAGKITLKKRQVRLDEAVLASLHALETSGRCREHEVVIDMAPALVEADPARIDQIATNLLTNAFKYTPSGGKIELLVQASEASALLSVCDNGIGIDADLLERIFEPFVQGPRAIDRAAGGLGIGLTMVRRLVDLHGGSVAASSNGEGCGACFSVSLPLSDPGAAELAGDTDGGASWCGKVLVIEDNADALEMTASMLTLSNFQVWQAKTGAEGIALAAMHMPDAAIVDIGLPDISGYEVARRMRADRRTGQIRLIALTGYGAPEDMKCAASAGFDIHMTKPVNFNRLLAVLKDASAAGVGSTG